MLTVSRSCLPPLSRARVLAATRTLPRTADLATVTQVCPQFGPAWAVATARLEELRLLTARPDWDPVPFLPLAKEGNNKAVISFLETEVSRLKSRQSTPLQSMKS